jgi:hypothetical protein
MGNNVLFNGQYFFAQTAGGTNYWIPNTAYLSATVSNEPPANDIIAFSDPGQRSLTFTTAVTDLVFAYVSINTNTYTFDHEFDLISNGEGFFGSGPVSKVNNGNGTWSLVAQSGEPHGVIQFAGTLSSLNWNRSAGKLERIHGRSFRCHTCQRARSSGSSGCCDRLRLEPSNSPKDRR